MFFTFTFSSFLTVTKRVASSYNTLQKDIEQLSLLQTLTKHIMAKVHIYARG